MKYIKLYCDNYDCDTEFLVKLNEAEEKLDYYVCPICESLVWTNDNCVVELPDKI